MYSWVIPGTPELENLGPHLYTQQGDTKAPMCQRNQRARSPCSEFLQQIKSPLCARPWPKDRSSSCLDKTSKFRKEPWKSGSTQQSPLPLLMISEPPLLESTRQEGPGSAHLPAWGPIFHRVLWFPSLFLIQLFPGDSVCLAAEREGHPHSHSCTHTCV